MNPEVLVSELETLSTKRRLSQGDKDRFVTLVEQLDKVDDWENSYPNLATFVSKTLDKMEDKEVIKRRIITKLRKESAFLWIFRSEDRVTILDETRVVGWTPRRAPRTGVDASKLSAEEKVLLSLPPNIRDNQKLINALSSMGIVVENGVARFGTSFEQQKKKEKLMQFLNFFNYLYENPTPEGIVDNYFCLLTGKGAIKSFEFIDDATRKYLRQMYIEAAFKRMNAKWMTIVKSTDNTRYEIFYNEAGKRNRTANGNVFERLVEGSKDDKTQASSEDLDFWIMFQIYSRENIFNKEPATEKSLIEGILKKHNIQAKKEGSAYTWGIIDASALEDNKDIVLEQINAKLEVLNPVASAPRAKGTEMPNSTQFADNIQTYQELAFLRSWLVWKVYENHEVINRTTKQVNEYWIYQQATALVWAKLSTPNAPTTVWGQMREIAWMALPFAIPLALFGWLTGHSKEAFYGLAGLLGLYVGGNVLDSSWAGALLKKWSDAIGATSNGNIDMRQQKPLPKIDPEYSQTLDDIIALNTKRKAEEKTGVVRWSFSNDMMLAKVYKEVIQSGYIKDLDLWSGREIYTLISAKGVNSLQVNRGDFTSVTNTTILGTSISREQVDILVGMLLERKEPGDKKLLDFAKVGGVDILNEVYVDETITWEADFDAKINAELRTLFTTWDRKKRAEVKEIIATLKRDKLYNLTLGFRDGVWEGLKSVPGKIFEKVVDSGKEVYTWGAAQMNYVEWEIKKLEATIKSLSTNHSTTTVETVKVLKEYVTYLKASSKLTSHEWIIDENANTAWFYSDKAKRLFLTGTTFIWITKDSSVASKVKFLQDLKTDLAKRKISLDDVNLGLTGLTTWITSLKSRRDKITAQIDTWVSFIDIEMRTVTEADNEAMRQRVEAALWRPVIPNVLGNIQDRYRTEPELLLKDILALANRLAVLETNLKSATIAGAEPILAEIKKIFGQIKVLQTEFSKPIYRGATGNKAQIVELSTQLLNDTSRGGLVKKVIKDKFEEYYKKPAAFHSKLSVVPVPTDLWTSLTALKNIADLQKSESVTEEWLAPYQIVGWAIAPSAIYNWFVGYQPSNDYWVTLNDRNVDTWLTGIEGETWPLNIAGRDKSITVIKRLLDERNRKIKEEFERVITAPDNVWDLANLAKIKKALTDNSSTLVDIGKIDAKILRLKSLFLDLTLDRDPETDANKKLLKILADVKAAKESENRITIAKIQTVEDQIGVYAGDIAREEAKTPKNDAEIARLRGLSETKTRELTDLRAQRSTAGSIITSITSYISSPTTVQMKTIFDFSKIQNIDKIKEYFKSQSIND